MISGRLSAITSFRISVSLKIQCTQSGKISSVLKFILEVLLCVTKTFSLIFVAYCLKRRKLLCYHRKNLFACVSRIARSSGRNWVGLYERGIRYGSHCCFEYMKYVSTAYCRKLVEVFKVSCFPFLNCFVSFLFDIFFLPALPLSTVYSLF